MNSRCVPLLALLFTLALDAASARAGEIRVSPVRVALGGARTSATLTLTNGGAAPVRIQATTHTWDELPDGRMALEPSDAVLAFPAFIELAPGASQVVRIGIRAPAAGSERTFRVVFEELPGSHKVAENTVAFRQRISVPIFVTPKGARPVVAIGPPAFRDGRLAFSLENRGDAFYMATRIVITAERAAPAEPVTSELRGWYVLAGGRRDYLADLPAGCVTGVRITVEAERHASTTIHAPLRVGCAE